MTLTDDTATTMTDLPWHLRNNWAPVLDERTDHDLRVEGTIPTELTGTYGAHGRRVPDSAMV